MYYTMNTKYINGQDFNHNTIIAKYLVMLLYYLEKPNWEEEKKSIWESLNLYDEIINLTS